MNTRLREQGLRRCKHSSSYFRGAYNKYGRYQWDVKYQGFNDEYEIEAAVSMALGEYDFKVKGWSALTDLLGRPIKSHLDGRSGGWLVIDTELTDEELEKVDEYIEECMEHLPVFLQEFRQERGEK